MKQYLLYNPLAANGKAVEALAALEQQLENTVRCDVTQITDYAVFFSQLEAQDRLIICGGDGTLNRFVNDTRDVAVPHEIGLYSIGTGNDFLRDIGKNRASFPDFSINAYLRRLPCVTVNGMKRLFLNGVGYGLDGYCCEIADEYKRRSSKPANYTLIALRGLLYHFKPVNATVTVDGVTRTYQKVWAAPTMQGRYFGGGMMCAPGQDRQNAEQTLSLVMIHSVSRARALTIFPKLFKGGHVRYTQFVEVLTGHDITVSFDRPTALQIDGETVLNVHRYHAISAAMADTHCERSRLVCSN